MNRNQLSRFAPLLLLCLCSSVSAQPELQFGSSADRGADFGVVAGEAGGAIVAGAIGLGLTYVAAVAALGQDELSPTLPAYVGVGGMAIGYSAGSALGTWLAGSITRQGRQASGAFLGALAGMPVCFGLLAVAAFGNTDIPPALLLVPAFAAPPAGAVIGYNLTRPCGCRETTRHESRLLVPGAGLRRERSGDAAAIALYIRLINARF